MLPQILQEPAVREHTTRLARGRFAQEYEAVLAANRDDDSHIPRQMKVLDDLNPQVRASYAGFAFGGLGC